MSKSENGWPVIESQSSPKLTVIRIPGTGIIGIPLRVQKDCAPLLAYVASLVHAQVSDLRKGNRPGVQDEGGYNLREIDGSTVHSNHSSGTAIDLNWTKWPMFKRRMNKKERSASEAIAKDLADVIRWGGNYRPARVDEMHWEIKPGVTVADIKKFLKARGINNKGEVKSASSKA
jgi:hypothetical protein